MSARHDRRRAARARPATPELQQVRIRAGPEATVLDYSEGGVRLASTMRLLPGRACTLSWTGIPGAPSTSGPIVRSTVGRIDATRGVLYHAAVAFAQPVSFLRAPTTQQG